MFSLRGHICSHKNSILKEGCLVISHFVYVIHKYTSIKDTRTAAIIANVWPASNVGAPHCKGYGNLNLKIIIRD